VEPRQWRTVDYPYGWSPIATYIFQYRSRSEWICLTRVLGLPFLTVTQEISRSKASSSARPLRRLQSSSKTAILPTSRLTKRAREAANAANQVVNRLKRERERDRSVTLAQGNGNEEDNTDGDDELTITAEWDRRKRVCARANAGGSEVIDLTED
jgi:hypothetical protein